MGCQRNLGRCVRCDRPMHLDDRSACPHCDPDRDAITTAVCTCHDCDPHNFEKMGIVPIENCSVAESVRRMNTSAHRLRAALKEALDLAERYVVLSEEETYFANGGSETKRRIAELRKESGVC